MKRFGTTCKKIASKYELCYFGLGFCIVEIGIKRFRARNMRLLKLKQFAASLLVVLALFLSSAAAICACSHHGTKAEKHVPSCHQVSPENEQTADTNEIPTSPKLGVACNCFVKTAQPFTVSKSENLKIQKTQAILVALPGAEKLDLIAQTASVKFHYTYYFYNSNYLSKQTPSRAPPAL